MRGPGLETPLAAPVTLPSKAVCALCGTRVLCVFVKSSVCVCVCIRVDHNHCVWVDGCAPSCRVLQTIHEARE